LIRDQRQKSVPANSCGEMALHLALFGIHFDLEAKPRSWSLQSRKMTWFRRSNPL